MSKEAGLTGSVTGSKTGASILGIAFTLVWPIAALAVCHLLYTALPEIPYVAPNRERMDLAEVANKGHFPFMIKINGWAAFLGPCFVIYALNSLKAVAYRAILRSALPTIVFSGTTILLATAYWFVTSVSQDAWLLSPHNPIEYYGNTPYAVVDYLLVTSVTFLPLQFGPAIAAVVNTAVWLESQRKVTASQGASQPHN